MWDWAMAVVRRCPGQCARPLVMLAVAGHWSLAEWAQGTGGSVSRAVGEGEHHHHHKRQCEPCHQEQGQILSQYQCQACPHSSDWEKWQLLLTAIFPATHNKVHLLQREAEHEANPALTAPGDNIRYRVCKLFALVLQSSNCGNVWFMWALCELQDTDRHALTAIMTG